MYAKVYLPNHPRADVTGHVMQHVLIAEEILGRKLNTGEVVHHKDFNKRNNDSSNLLFPISRKEHQQLPKFQARFIIHRGLYDEFLEFWTEEKIKEIEEKLQEKANKIEKLKSQMKGGA